MPIYEYQCAACGQIVEKWQKLSEEPLTVCGACGGPLHKLISNCAFHLKGSGWYVTDYAGSRPNSATGDQAKESGSDPARSSSAAGDSGSSSVK